MVRGMHRRSATQSSGPSPHWMLAMFKSRRERLYIILISGSTTDSPSAEGSNADPSEAPDANPALAGDATLLTGPPEALRGPFLRLAIQFRSPAELNGEIVQYITHTGFRLGLNAIFAEMSARFISSLQMKSAKSHVRTVRTIRNVRTIGVVGPENSDPCLRSDFSILVSFLRTVGFILKLQDSWNQQPPPI
jgi:hypothetical protein